ncbi:uncharacterized protein GGS22DRAFT_191462 [Annulohypoxylon maeteangense]|uniref:uncharacterized protein n=1 Tax=Annulohypoxylon maeteangense TaxID=1927788 RepID=UPI00200730E8|nr:uncharacterized protein GGS22DRAFT_191462 [Annulohypoxylon maeteangense]KAI0882293.1 hypothetical protein GGS22DRAFT_191462 [Annulohypoxylon maeteangense]
MSSTGNTQTTKSSSSAEKPESSKDSDTPGSSGGYYKFRCKYFLTHNCNNWVYVNGSPCANCCEDEKPQDDYPISESPAEDDKPHGEIVQCEKCHCWVDDRPHTCKPEDKDKYAKDGK